MSMIALDPCKRITARQALKHPYFDDLDVNRVNMWEKWIYSDYEWWNEKMANYVISDYIKIDEYMKIKLFSIWFFDIFLKTPKSLSIYNHLKFVKISEKIINNGHHWTWIIQRQWNHLRMAKIDKIHSWWQISLSLEVFELDWILTKSIV